MKYYRTAFILLAAALVWAYFYGGPTVLATVLVLCVLEVSVSSDNAVLNAKVLATMDAKWQKRFIIYGIPIAVFGMRLLFPILIVAVAASMSMWDSFMLAINDVEKYKTVLQANEHTIFAFGGSFLLMVFLSFIFNGEKETHWIKPIENNRVVSKLSTIESTSFIIASVGGLYLTHLTLNPSIAIAYFSGIVLFAALRSLDSLLPQVNGVRSGLAGFIYLEVLDASFSFDGVIGAFALSSDIFVIMVGLGIGAWFVRAITLHLVAAGTLTEYRYLEHGAHYAIGALALIMFMKMFTHVNEIVVGLLGVAFIVVAIIHSKYSEPEVK